MMTKKMLWLLIASLTITAAPFAAVQGTAAEAGCGNIHAVVHAVALPDNGAPPHEQHLDQTWLIPPGSHKQYGGSPNGEIVTQGYPHNGGSHSWEYLSTTCAVTSQGQNPPVRQLKTTSTSDLASGVGKGTGASSDFDTTWFVVENLPLNPSNKPWSLSVIGIVNASNTTPNCSVTINNDQPKVIPSGPFIHTIGNLTGAVGIFLSCSQGHMAIFPNGPAMRTANIVIDSDITLSFSRQ